MGLFESKIAHAIRVGDLVELRTAVQNDENGLKNFRDSVSGWNALHYAAQAGHPDVITEICRKNCCDVNAKSNWSLVKGQQTPLHVAVIQEQTRAIPALIEHGADWRIEDQGGWAPMAWAVHRDSEGTMRALLMSGVDVNRSCTKDATWLRMQPTVTGRGEGGGPTPLMMSVTEDKVKAAQILLAFGTASPTCRAEAFAAALAADSGRQGIVQAFLAVRAISSSQASAHVSSLVTREAHLTGELEVMGLNVLRAEAEYDRLRRDLDRHRAHDHSHDHRHHRDHHRPGHHGHHHHKGGHGDGHHERLEREVSHASAALAAARAVVQETQSRLTRIRALIGMLSAYTSQEAAREAQAAYAQAQAAQAQQAQAYAAACQRAAAPTAPPQEAPVPCSAPSFTESAPAAVDRPSESRPEPQGAVQPTAGTNAPDAATGSQGAAAGSAAESEDKTCPICLENAKNTALVPCGHVLCGGCVLSLTGGAAPGTGSQGVPCPICRKPVHTSIRIFM